MAVYFEDIVQGIKTGFFTNHVHQIIMAFLPGRAHSFCHNDRYPLFLKQRIECSESLSGRVVDVVNRGHLNAEPAQWCFCLIDQGSHLFSKLLRVGEIYAVCKAINHQPRLGLHTSV